jgi:hypothetical protein
MVGRKGDIPLLPLPCTGQHAYLHTSFTQSFIQSIILTHRHLTVKAELSRSVVKTERNGKCFRLHVKFNFEISFNGIWLYRIIAFFIIFRSTYRNFLDGNCLLLLFSNIQIDFPLDLAISSVKFKKSVVGIFFHSEKYFWQLKRGLKLFWIGSGENIANF